MKPTRVPNRFDGTYVIVENPGDSNEKVVEENLTFTEAMRLCEHYTQGGTSADIQRRLPDGTLTAEY